MESSVNQRVSTLRNELGFSQNEFARKLEMTAPAINRIESGVTNPSARTLKSISNTFGVRMEWLLKGDGEMFLPGKVFDKESSHHVNWTEEAFTTQKQYINTLEKEVEWLRGLVTKLTGSVNFPNGIDTAGMFLNPVNSVRAVA